MNTKEYFELVDKYVEKFGKAVPMGLQVSDRKLISMLKKSLQTGIPIPDDDCEYQIICVIIISESITLTNSASVFC